MCVRGVPRGCFKRLIIKHFHHTFNREKKNENQKLFFRGEISDRKFENLKKIENHDQKI